MTTIGTAYVQVLPSVEGIQNKLKSALNGPAADAGNSAGTESGQSFIGSMTGKLKSGAGKIVKVGAAAAAAAVTAAATGLSFLTKSAVSEYAEYEQLVGGVETLFKGSADTVQQYAANAYKTAGLSANEYMETVTSFSASLLQSLGGNTAKAAQMADLAVTDMSDNANKLGTDMKSIQNAYQGFAKQNFTMLDNLKLGYGGTKEEMQRLIDDANKLREAQGLNADLTIDSYADIVTAIHDVQTEIGITGTTQEEAAKTIQGSLAAMKSAWKNLVTGLGDPNADLGLLVDNVVGSAETAFGNLTPVIERAVTGIGTVVEKIAPVIAERLPGLVQAVLPSLLSAATSLVGGLVSALPAIVQVLVDVGPQIVIDLATAIVQNLPALLKAAGQLALGLLQALASLVSQLIEMGAQWISGLIKGLRNKIADTRQAATDLVSNVLATIRQKIENFKSIGRDLIGGLISGITQKARDIIDSITGVISNAIGAAKRLLGISSPSKVFAAIGGYTAEGFGVGWEQAFAKVRGGIENDLAFSGSVSMAGRPDFRSYDFSPRPVDLASQAGTVTNNITMNVYAAPGQSEEEIARKVERKIAQNIMSREAVWV